MSAILEKTLEIASRLEVAESPESSLRRIMENEIRRRLNRYELMARRFQEKYGMTFEQFRDRNMVEHLSYSFEAESDFCDWEMAISGIRSLRSDLAEITL